MSVATFSENRYNAANYKKHVVCYHFGRLFRYRKRLKVLYTHVKLAYKTFRSQIKQQSKLEYQCFNLRPQTLQFNNS